MTFDGHSAPGPARLRYRRVYHGEETQIRDLRRWICGRFPECAARDDVLVVAAEFATNAVKHTGSGRGGYFTVQVSWHRTAVLVAVADEGAATGPSLAATRDPLAESGRGLQVVRGLATRYGVTGDRDGRVVWAELSWPRDIPVPALPGNAPDLPGDDPHLPRTRPTAPVTATV